MEMVCNGCGKPLKKAYTLTDDEVKNMEYFQALNMALNTALENFSYSDSDKKNKIIINRLYSKKAALDISRGKFFNELKNKYNLKGKKYFIKNGEVFIHE